MPNRTSPASTVEALPQRLTREQSKAQTRARLLEVGRRHILRSGLGDAVAERIAEDAGYSRGAFYGNFADKEDLFLNILREDQDRQFALFHAILEDAGQTSAEILQRFRDMLADRMTDPEWILLAAEFEAVALRSERMREHYIQLHRRVLRDGRTIVDKLAQSPDIQLTLAPGEFLLAILSFTHGLAVKQRLLGEELSTRSARRLVRSVFNQLVTVVPSAKDV